MFRIGDTVHLLESKATIKYIGTLAGREGTWVGCEFDKALGSSNGTLENISYFKAKDKHGLFIRYDKVLKSFYSRKNKKEINFTNTIKDLNSKTYIENENIKNNLEKLNNIDNNFNIEKYNYNDEDLNTIEYLYDRNDNKIEIDNEIDNENENENNLEYNNIENKKEIDNNILEYKNNDNKKYDFNNEIENKNIKKYDFDNEIENKNIKNYEFNNEIENKNIKKEMNLNLNNKYDIKNDIYLNTINIKDNLKLNKIEKTQQLLKTTQNLNNKVLEIKEDLKKLQNNLIKMNNKFKHNPFIFEIIEKIIKCLENENVEELNLNLCKYTLLMKKYGIKFYI